MFWFALQRVQVVRCGAFHIIDEWSLMLFDQTAPHRYQQKTLSMRYQPHTMTTSRSLSLFLRLYAPHALSKSLLLVIDKL